MMKQFCQSLCCIMLAFAFLATGQLNIKAEEIQREIASQVIRLHIRANSDSEQDQLLKMQVKEVVTDYLAEVLAESGDIDESRELISESLPEIQEKAKAYVEDLGYDYEVRAALDMTYFPVKTYGDMTFPKGEYEALVIEIGEGAGQNWWCVVYPQLCFVDATYGYVPEESKNQLKDILTEEAYEAVADDEPEIRFWLLDLLTSH